MFISIKQITYKAGMLLLFITFLISCKKGDEGPPGTANVKYSDWFTPNAYTSATIHGIKHFTYEKDAPEITQFVLDSGVVIVFGKLLGYNTNVWPAGQVSQMPIALTYFQSGSTMTDTWSALTTPQKLKIRFLNDRNEYNVIATTHQFRYVIVPGGTKVSGRRAANYQQMSYSEICALLQITE